jgi:hypothetical protein
MQNIFWNLLYKTSTFRNSCEHICEMLNYATMMWENDYSLHWLLESVSM